MMEVYIREPARIVDSWNEIDEAGKYVLRDNPNKPVIVNGFNGYWSVGYLIWENIGRGIVSSFWIYAKTKKTEQPKNFRTLDTLRKYVKKELCDYWSSGEPNDTSA
jgi:hypothetical protein